MRGASAIRLDWGATVEQVNAALFEALDGAPRTGFRGLAERLFDVLPSSPAFSVRRDQRAHRREAT